MLYAAERARWMGAHTRSYCCEWDWHFRRIPRASILYTPLSSSQPFNLSSLFYFSPSSLQRIADAVSSVPSQIHCYQRFIVLITTTVCQLVMVQPLWTCNLGLCWWLALQAALRRISVLKLYQVAGIVRLAGYVIYLTHLNWRIVRHEALLRNSR